VQLIADTTEDESDAQDQEMRVDSAVQFSSPSSSPHILSANGFLNE